MHTLSVSEKAKTAIVTGLEKVLAGRNTAEVSQEEFFAAMPKAFPYHPCTRDVLHAALRFSRMDLTECGVDRLRLSRVSAATVKPTSAKSMPELLAGDAARVRKQPWTSHKSTMAREEIKTATPVSSEATGWLSAHLLRLSQDLQAECAGYGFQITTTAAVDHIFAEAAAKKGTPLTGQQIAFAAQIEQARLRARGITVTASEAVQRVMNKQAL